MRVRASSKKTAKRVSRSRKGIGAPAPIKFKKRDCDMCKATTVKPDNAAWVITIESRHPRFNRKVRMYLCVGHFAHLHYFPAPVDNIFNIMLKNGEELDADVQ